MWKIKQIGPGDKITNDMYNEIVVRLNQMTRVFGNVSGQLTTQGFHINTSPVRRGSGLTFFSVVSNDTGDGVYNCK